MFLNILTCCCSAGQRASDQRGPPQRDGPGDHPEQPVRHLPGRHRALLRPGELHQRRVTSVTSGPFRSVAGECVSVKRVKLVAADDGGGADGGRLHPLGRQVLQLHRLLGRNLRIHL